MSATTLSNRQQLVKVVVGGALGLALLVGCPAVGLTQDLMLHAVATSIVIYENPNFGGRSQTLGVGGHKLSDFNDIASSIRVPAGLVALLYEDVDAGGGYGLSVDLLEDRPDLSQVNFKDKLSYVCVFFSTTPQGYIWARASMQNGQFVAGHWERQGAGGTPVNSTAVVARPLSPHPPGAPPASCEGGTVVMDHRGGAGAGGVTITPIPRSPVATTTSMATDGMMVLQNHWKPDKYVNIQNAPVTAGGIQPGWASARWTLEPVPGTTPTGYHIRNVWKPDQYLNIESGALVAGPIQPGWLSAMWHLQLPQLPVGWTPPKLPQGAPFPQIPLEMLLVRIQNVWKPDQFLNIESGPLVASPIQPGWLSAQWKVIKASGCDTWNLSQPPPPPQYSAAPILETTYRNPPFDTSRRTWASDIVHGQTIIPSDSRALLKMGISTFTGVQISGGTALREWTQIFNPKEDYEVDLVGLSGRAIVLGDVGKGVSNADVYFVHPFGFKDWEFWIAPDAAYQNLAAPAATPVHCEYAESVIRAQADFGLIVPNTVGVETDVDLVPLNYRVQYGDRVAVWGRWIVDAGHPDFHTEIHPPLVLATGRATSPDETTTTVIGRPYLTGQTWPDGGVVDHLMAEAEKVRNLFSLNPFADRSKRVEAHEPIMEKAWQGTYSMSYTVRPPTPRKLAGDPMSAVAADRLMASFHFTVRTGVTVQVANIGDAVSVNIVMNSNLHKRVALPPKHDFFVTREMLAEQDSRAGDLYKVEALDTVLFGGVGGGAVVGGLVGSGIEKSILEDGILTDKYDAPVAPPNVQMISVPVDSLHGNTPVSVDDGQPWPLAGTLTLTWERGGAAGGILRNP